MTPLNAALIRTADIALSASGLLVLAVPMAIVAIAIRADGGPALFRQRRVGRCGMPFEILKFRTMRHSGEAGSGEVRGEGATALAEARQRFQTTQMNDPRITRVGAPLRKLHIDELPQLLNVLKGDMSLVGVRPDTPAQEQDYSSEYWRVRHSLRPGITGTAQLINAATMAERTARELEWLEKPGFGRYVGILVATVAKVARRSGI